jgi:hypothetical protein
LNSRPNLGEASKLAFGLFAIAAGAYGLPRVATPASIAAMNNCKLADIADHHEIMGLLQ